MFKGRLGDFRERDTAAERCEVAIQDDIANTECRIVVRMICKHGRPRPQSTMIVAKLTLLPGVTKTYKLNYESTDIKHALFNRNVAKNKWRISASVLRLFLEYFGTATEQLDIYAEDGRVAFTSYTEKVMHGRGIAH